MRESTEDRIVKINRTFREANERIRARAQQYDAPLERIPFLCECPRPDCVQIVRLTISEYSDVRANPVHFFTAPCHENDEEPLGKVVVDHGEYVVVAKDRV